MTPSAAPLAWTEWGTAVFTKATLASRPVFLFLSPRWSPEGSVLESAVLHDEMVAGVLADRFELVRVDPEERPDIAERYSLGRWPTLLLLTPAGAVLTGGTWTDAEQLRRRLTQVADAFHERHGEFLPDVVLPDARHAPAGGPGHPPDIDVVAALAEWCFANRGALVREVGVTPGAPDATLLAALLLAGHRLQLPAMFAVVGDVLDAALRQGLFDQVRGGVRHVAPASIVGGHELKLLEENAGMLEVLLDASALLDREDFRAIALGVAQFLQDDLRDAGEGGFSHAWSRRCLDEDGRVQNEAGRGRGRATRDSRLFTDGNARVARALFNASRVLGLTSFAEHAIAALERVLGGAYQRGAGVAHVLDGRPRVRGLLVDQVTASAALLDAHDMTGLQVYLDLSEELMRSALRKFAHADTAALQDRLHGPSGAGDVGLLAQSRFPLAANSLAARVLHALSGRLDDGELRQRAVDLLGAFGSSWRTATPGEAAHFALAVIEVVRC